jgi:hypothetical protein
VDRFCGFGHGFGGNVRGVGGGFGSRHFEVMLWETMTVNCVGELFLVLHLEGGVDFMLVSM